MATLFRESDCRARFELDTAPRKRLILKLCMYREKGIKRDGARLGFEFWILGYGVFYLVACLPCMSNLGCAWVG